jgi:hypothetical protein
VSRAEHLVVQVAGPDDAERIGTLLHVFYPTLMPASYPADVLARALPRMMRANSVCAPDCYRDPCRSVSKRVCCTDRVVGIWGWLA